MNNDNYYGNDTQYQDDQNMYGSYPEAPKKNNDTVKNVVAAGAGLALGAGAGIAGVHALSTNEEQVQPVDPQVENSATEENDQLAEDVAANKSDEVINIVHEDVVDHHHHHPYHHYHPFYPYYTPYAHYDVNYYNQYDIHVDGDQVMPETQGHNVIADASAIYDDGSISVLGTRALTTNDGLDMNMALLQDNDSGEQAVIVDLMDDYGQNIPDSNADFLMSQDGEIVDLTNEYVPMPNGSYQPASQSYESYDEPSYNEPSSYNEPTYNEPSYDMPSYDEPSMDTPSFDSFDDGGAFDGGSDGGDILDGYDQMSI